MLYQLPNETRTLQLDLRRFFDETILPIANARDHGGMLSRAELSEIIGLLKPIRMMWSAVPKEFGGDGRSVLERAIYAEETARVWPSLAFTVDTHAAIAAYIATRAPDWMREQLLPSAFDGSRIFCDMMSEPDSGSDTRNLKTTAVRVGDTYVINGEKMWQTNGPWADVGLLSAVIDQQAYGRDHRTGVVQLAVMREESEWTVRDLPLMGANAGATGHFVFKDMVVPAKNLIASEGAGYQENLKTRGWARVNLAATTLGIMQAALDDAISYAKTRRTFGKVIAGHQLVQDMVADMAIDLDASRLLVYRTAELMDNGIRCDIEQATAKAFAAEAAKRVTDKAIQILGARGLTRHEGYRTERLYRDARVTSVAEGTTQILKLVIGRGLLGVQAFS